MKTFHLLTRDRKWVPMLAPSAKAALQHGRDLGLEPKGIAGGAKCPKRIDADAETARSGDGLG